MNIYGVARAKQKSNNNFKSRPPEARIFKSFQTREHIFKNQIKLSDNFHPSFMSMAKKRRRSTHVYALRIQEVFVKRKMCASLMFHWCVCWMDVQVRQRTRSCFQNDFLFFFVQPTWHKFIRSNEFLMNTLIDSRLRPKIASHQNLFNRGHR